MTTDDPLSALLVKGMRQMTQELKAHLEPSAGAWAADRKLVISALDLIDPWPNIIVGAVPGSRAELARDVAQRLRDFIIRQRGKPEELCGRLTALADQIDALARP